MSHTTANDDSNSLDEIRNSINDLEITNIEQETRFITVLVNLYYAFFSGKKWKKDKKIAAVKALITNLLFGKPAVLMSIGFGTLLALQANYLFSEQNAKVDLQNHLTIVSNQLNEAQRNSQFIQMLPQVVSDIQSEKKESEPVLTSDQYAGNRKLTNLSPELNARIAALSQSFQPYRWVVDDSVLVTQESTSVFARINRFLGFSQINSLETPPVPILSKKRYSPERGQLLITLHSFDIKFAGLFQTNVSFEKVYAPNARLQFLSLASNMGPMNSNKGNFSGAYFDGADLSFSNFDASNFEHSILTNSKVIGSNMSYCELNGTDFSNAILDNSNLSNAKLAGVDFTNVTFCGTNLANTDLSKTVPNSLTTEQLTCGCLNKETTILPDYLRFDYSTYKLPERCKERWPFDFE